jgi:hypothetical protein
MGGRCSTRKISLRFPTRGKIDDEAEGPAGCPQISDCAPASVAVQSRPAKIGVMAHFWFILSLKWPLEDVQAALNVLISVFSAIGIFTFARFCWQSATLHLTKQRDVPVASLLSLTSPGEAFQVLWFLNFRSLSAKKYRRILFQSLIIFGLSVAAILSGPIARYASRQGHTVIPVEMHGSLATTTWESMVEADVAWNRTKNTLADAGFPSDQLLDFLPDISQPWVYREDEWNNTWHAQCQFDPLTPISLSATGNYSDGSWFTEIPGLYDIVPLRFIDLQAEWTSNLGAASQGDRYTDVLMFFVTTIQPKEGIHFAEDISMGLLISAIHLHDAPMAPLDSNGTFGKGPIGKSSYTRAICDLERSAATINATNIAYPNLILPFYDDTFSQAIEEHYHAPFFYQAVNNLPLWVPTGEDMFRFYQAYLISKDTQDYCPVKRIISTQVPTVELSSVFLAVVILIGFLIVAGLIHHSFFLLRYRSAISQMPESKLDWLLQSLREAERINRVPETSGERPGSSTTPKPRTTFDSASYRWQDKWHEDGRKSFGAVVLEEDVEMESPSQTFQQSPTSRPQHFQSFQSFSSFQPYQHVEDSTSLISRPERHTWHYCSGHGEECADRVDRHSLV